MESEDENLEGLINTTLVRLYELMPGSKYVIAMGACTITGGMFSATALFSSSHS
jgi:NADH:ubiquinone oxidoreductase subunit B-like Fe-S oxidoreductase